MFFSLSTTAKKRSRYKQPELQDRIIAYIVLGFWGLIIIFGAISLTAPNWLQKISEPGAISEARDLKKNGDQFLRSKKYQMAANAYNKAIKINPEMYTAIGNLGIVYAKMGELDKAILSHKYMMKIIPEMKYIAYQNLAELYEKKKDFSTAISYYQKSAEENPFPQYPLNKAGYLYIQKRDADMAIECFDTSLELSNNMDFIYLGMFKKRLASPEISEEDTDKFTTLLKAGISKEEMKKFDYSYFQRLKRSDKELAKLYSNIGDAYLMKKEINLALENYNNALAIRPSFKAVSIKKEKILEMQKNSKKNQSGSK